MADEDRRKLWATDLAKKITTVLLVLQLAACAVDLTSRQVSLISVFCIATVPDNPPLEWAAGIVWLILAFSWVIGAMALRLSNLRPIYWLLIVAIPIALLAQQSLIRSKILYCDAP